jgi:hypothetical protein
MYHYTKKRYLVSVNVTLLKTDTSILDTSVISVYYTIILEQNIKTSLVRMAYLAIPKILYFLFIANKATNI